MKLPNQAKPVNRQVATIGFTTKGIAPSDYCGCGEGKQCGGICLFGNICVGGCF